MTDSQSNENWVNDWLAQQRAALERARAAKLAPDSKSPPADAWRAAADKYLEALRSVAGPDAGNRADTSFQPFALGEELLRLWRTAWESADTTRQAATANFAEFAQRLPSLGIASEQTQLWRDLAVAQAECHVLEQELRKVFLKLHHDALDLLEKRLKEEQPRKIATFRELYDLWVECAEQIYARLAQTDAFARLQADLASATFKLRAHQQKIVEQALRQFDLPTRSEINSVHLQLRDLKRRVAQLEGASARVSTRTARSKSGKAASKRSRGARR